METKKEIFKLLIKEFHELKPLRIIKRNHQLPDYCTALGSGSSPLSSTVSSRPSSVIAITGPRRCGKTYFIHQLIDDFCSNPISPILRNRLFYINFEDDRLLPLTLPDLASLPDAYFELYPDNRDKEVFIFLDEIQLVEGWQLFLRRLLDYVSYFVEKGLISLIPIFSDSPKVQQVNPKKVYSLDNGIRNAVSFPLPHH